MCKGDFQRYSLSTFSASWFRSKQNESFQNGSSFSLWAAMRVLESQTDFVGFRLNFYSLLFVLTGYCDLFYCGCDTSSTLSLYYPFIRGIRSWSRNEKWCFEFCMPWCGTVEVHFFCGFYEHVHCPNIFTLAKETQIRKKKKSPRRFVYIKEGQKDMTLSKIMACVICIIDVLLVLLFQTRPFFVCNANVIPSNHSILRKKCPFLSFFFFY